MGMLFWSVPSSAGPCFPAWIWVDEVARYTAGRSPLLDVAVVRASFEVAAKPDVNVDPRLQLAIAGQESGFGTRGPCPAVNNAWGVLQGGRCRPFRTWVEATRWVTAFLGRCYVNFVTGNCRVNTRPRRTIAEIGELWCQSGCGNWVANVTGFYESYKGNAGDLLYRGTCCGDCNRNGAVDIADLVHLVNVALWYNVPFCPSAEMYVPDQEITVDEIITAINEAQWGCL